MKLLGSYESKLTSWYYQGLLDMLKQAIQLGDYAGSKTFDTSTLQQLVNDAQDFSSLPTPSAGQRVTDDTLNQPLQLLSVRFASLVQEASDFDSKALSLINVLEKDTVLLDQLLAMASLDDWASAQPQLGGAETGQWDFASGQGKTSISIPLSNPSTGVLYSNKPAVETFLTLADGVVRTGLVPASSATTIPVKTLTWSFNPGFAQVENLTGNDWAELSLLEPAPLVNYHNINTTVILPTFGVLSLDAYLHISGNTINGTVPTFVRVLYIPRQVQRSFPNTVNNITVPSVTNGVPIVLSPNGYKFALDGITVSDSGTFYTEVYDYTLDVDSGTLTPLHLDPTKSVSIMFTELYPAYQCSVNELNWSSLIMLDPINPYPDNEKYFEPINWGPNGEFPITDDQGNPTGLYLSVVSPLKYEFYIQVATLPDPDHGAVATLEIEFEQPSFITGLNISPYTTYPVSLRRVELASFDNTVSVFEGSTIVDRNLTLSFTRQLVRKAILTFYQENYTFKNYTVQQLDSLRRSIMSQVQPLLPYSIQRTSPSVPFNYNGALYEFGFESISGEDRLNDTPTVFVSGPYRFTNIPEIVRFDGAIRGQINSYICYQCSDGNGAIKDLNIQGFSLPNGTCTNFPLSSTTDKASIDHTDVWVKLVFNSNDALIERLLVQVASHVQ